MKNFIKSVVVVSGLFLCFAVNAQNTSDKEEEDISALIAPYSSDVRDAVLDVAQYPQKLVRVDRMQAGTSQSFKDLVAKYPRETQEKFYDISRYPDLINQLTESGNAKSKSEVSTILASYPKEIASSVNDLYPSHFSELQSMDRTIQQSEASLRDIIGSLPTATQNNFIKVIGMPDVMKILTERIDQTVTLGEAYRDDPSAVKQNLNELNTQVTAQNAKDLDEYKQQVASDPELQSEMKKSSDEFSANYGRNDYPTNGNNNQPIVNNYYTANPYPYWFGYPYWYPSAVWYPQPLYYHTGFYVAGGNVVVVGLPSYAYSHWFFGYGYRRYPMMYRHYHSYYSYQYRPAYYRYNNYNYARRERYNGGYNNNSNYNQSRGRVAGGSRYSQQNPQNGGSINGRYNGSTRQSNPVTMDRSQSRGSFNPGNNFDTQRNNSRSQFSQQNPVRSDGMMRGNGGGMRRSPDFNGGGSMRSGGFGGGGRSSGLSGGGGSRGSGGGGGGGRRGR